MFIKKYYIVSRSYKNVLDIKNSVLSIKIMKQNDLTVLLSY